MRFLGLYLRSRQVPVALAVMIVGALGLWALNQDDVRLTALGLGLGAAVASAGLSGADVQLDRTAAVPWAPRRAAHLAAIAVVISGLTLGADLGVVVRDCAGMAGLAGLGSAAFGRQLAWVPAVAWTLVAVTFGVTDEVVTWMLQPAGVEAANVTAAVLAAVGGWGYCFFGPRDRL